MSIATIRALIACLGLGVVACVPQAEEATPATPASGGQPTGRGGAGQLGATGGTADGNAGGTGGGTGGAGAGTGGTGPASGGTTGTGGVGGSLPAPTDVGPVDVAPPLDGPAAPVGPRKVALLVGDPNTRDPSRSQMIELLTAMKTTHGIELEVMDSQGARAANFRNHALIIAGPNNNYCIDTPDPGFQTLPVPIIVSRDCKTTAFGLGTMRNTQNYLTTPVNIVIEKVDHPLAAALPKGTVPVLSTKCRLVRGFELGPDAIKIARPPDDATPALADSWAIFAYDKGGRMAGGLRAPAKRMGFFWHRPSAVTEEGKKLFAAAIEWSLKVD